MTPQALVRFRAQRSTSLSSAAAPLARLGALQRWRKELARGERRPDTYDHLWRAACWETSALEADAAGQRASARRLMDKASEALAAGVVTGA